jgi:predicted permease
VVGVTPPGFTAPTLGVAPEIWVPMALQPEVRPPSAGLRRSLGGAGMLDARGVRWMDMVGRLKTGTTVRDAATAVEIVAKRLEASFPNSNRARRFTVVRLGEGPGVRAATRPLLTVLGISVVLVLLIACANIASLLAARAVSRTREVAVRMAVGADRGRLIRQWLTESILLALMGSAGALVVAWGATPLLYRFGVPESVSLGLNTRVFLFTLAAGAGCGVLFGLAPVVQVLRRDTLAALRDEGGTIASGVRAARMRSVFVVVQVALSLMLLVGAGLFLRTLQNAYAVDLGYRLDGTLVANINLDVRGYSQPAGQAVYSQLLERVNALPGVSAAGASRVPVLTGGARTGTLSVDGRPVAPDGSNGLNVRINVVSDRYFETMGIPIVLGRRFSPSDAGTAPRVAVISRQLADRLWPGQDPLGRSLTYAPPALTVIGVVPDTAYSSAVERNPPPVFYVPLAQNYESGVAIYIRTAGDPMSLLPAVRQIVREIDPGLVVVRPRTLVDEFAGSLGNQRLMATLVGLFGGLALLLAAIGLYGVMAHMAAQRTAEIGIRLALGARPSSILTMIVRQGLRLVAIGGAIGLAGAMISVRSVESQLFGVKPTDPTTFVVVAVLLAIVGVLACAVPARRAMKVDPARTLRGA